MASFDEFLATGCPANSPLLSQKAMQEGRAISTDDIRDWPGSCDPETTERAVLDRLVQERRTKLWKMAFASIRGTPSQPAAPSLGFYELRASPSVYKLPLQQAHTSRWAIPSDLADETCTTLDSSALLTKLERILGKAEIPSMPLLNYLTECTKRGWDFGTVYGYMRPLWSMSAIDAANVLMVRIHPPQTTTGELLGPDDKDISAPRRIWDLYSNRVLDWADLRIGRWNQIPRKVWAVSHCWVDKPQRHDIQTPINGGKWPVPIPRSTTLDHVRIELLNMGAEYVFLDVLCLRQGGAGFESETQRAHEWARDIPSIGDVYRHDRYQTTIVYFNGLGLPLDIHRGLFDSTYHSFNRVWTLQETAVNWLPGGLNDSFYGDSADGPCFMDRLQKSLDVSTLDYPSLAVLLTAMSHRPGFADKKPYDQVAAVQYLHRPMSRRLVYHESVFELAEDAWDAYVAHLDDLDHLRLLVDYVLSGHGIVFWRPTWRQLMEHPYFAPEPSCAIAPDEVLRTTTFQVPGRLQLRAYHTAYVIQGVLISKASRRVTIKLPATSAHLPPPKNETFEFDTFFDLGGLADDREFTLVGVADLECWIIGDCAGTTVITTGSMADPQLDALMVKKFTVGRMNDGQERERLRALGLGRRCCVCYS